MKKLTIILIAAITGLFSIANAQTARVQAVHNSPDPGAATVDIWLSHSMMAPTKILDDFDYKEASPFIDAPAGIPITLSVTAPSAMDTTNAVYHKNLTLTSGDKYIVVASGGLAETGATAFDLRAYSGMEMANNQGAGEISVKAIHGSYDAPMVDIYEVQIPAGEIVPDLDFGSDAGYLDLPATDYNLQVRLQSGDVFKQFDADLSMYSDSAVALIATGFADTSAAVGNEPFGLLAVFPDGTVAELPEQMIDPARVQVIHNTPDPAASTVDVWLSYANMTPVKILNDFDYQEASPFIDVPPHAALKISVTGSAATDTSNAVFHKSFNLPANSKAIVVASGGLAETGATAFDLRAYSGMEMANNQGAGEISVKAIHGSYDAPMVDIHEVQVPSGELIPDLDFGSDAGYLDLPAADFDLQVKLQTGEAFKEFDADLSMYSDSAVAVLATGYVDPSSAVGTEPFGLLAVFPDGTVAALPEQMITPAKLQVIHNSAATDADSVDVWLNDNLLLDDFKFRTATSFVDAPAGEFFDVSVALPTSTDTVGALFKKEFLLESNQKYIVVASGNVGSGSYSPATPFDLVAIPDAREMSVNPSNVDVLVYHGSTDAPMVDINEITVPVNGLVTDISYGEYSSYLDLAEMDYQLEITASGSTVETYNAPLQTLGLAGNAITVLASGYLDPSMNNNGAGIGLWVATAAGGDLLELSTVSDVEDVKIAENISVYPNPTADNLNIILEDKNEKIESVKVLNGLGRVIRSIELYEEIDQNSRLKVNVKDLPEGRYFVKIQSLNTVETFNFIKTN